MNKFKNSLSVTGSLNHLEVFAKDLEDIGYKHGNLFSLRGDHKRDKIFTRQSGEYDFYNIPPDDKDVILNLPADWQKALELAGEKEEVKEEFKYQGLAVALSDCITTKSLHPIKAGEIKKLHDNVNLNSAAIYFEDTPVNEGYYFKKDFRPANLEEELIFEANSKGFVKGATVTTRGRIFEIDKLTTKNYQGRDIDTLYLWSKGNRCECSIDEAKLLPSYPLIEINGYKAEFKDWGLDFNNGCAKIEKGMFEDIYKGLFANRNYYSKSNKEITGIKIGEGFFTVKQIQEIANYYNKKS